MKGVTKSTHTINAAYPRSHPNSTMSPNDQLKIVYERFQKATEREHKKHKVNILFAHGNGMNRNIWKYYVNKIFEYVDNNVTVPFEINKIITFDSINHGDSAIANEYKLGVSFQWLDNAKDIIEIIKAERINLDAKLILVGHSFGGCSALMSNLFAPDLIDSVIAIDPVIFDVKFNNSKLSKSQQKVSSSQSMKYSLHKLSKGLSVFQQNYETKEDIYLAFSQSSTFKNFNKQILKDMIDGDIIKDDTDNKFHFKTTYEQQMIVFASSSFTIRLFHLLAADLTNKILFLVAKDSKFFNFERFSDIKKDNITLSIVPQGGHLVHCEFPDICIEKIMAFIGNRFTNANDDHFEKIKNSLNENSSVLESLSKKYRQENFNLMFKDLLERGFGDINFISDLQLRNKL